MYYDDVFGLILINNVTKAVELRFAYLNKRVWGRVRR